jgi:hypothetical protein
MYSADWEVVGAGQYYLTEVQHCLTEVQREACDQWRDKDKRPPEPKLTGTLNRRPQTGCWSVLHWA